MLYPDFRILKYRYKFADRSLGEFIRERYMKNRPVLDMEELITDRIKLNGMKVSPEVVLKKGDVLEYLHRREDEGRLEPDVPILYQDENFLAVSKPDFLPVTPSAKYYYNSLAILTREKFNDIEISPAHRLDIETGGVLLFSKNKKARREIQLLFQTGRMRKLYQAVTFGDPKPQVIAGDLVPQINSKIFTKLALKPADEPNSLTVIERKLKWGYFTRLWIKPATGKTNQIRAHLAAVGCPIVGDKKYFRDESVFLDWFHHRDIKRILPRIKLERQALHCQTMSFIHPFSGKELAISDHTSKWEDKIRPLRRRKKRSTFLETS